MTEREIISGLKESSIAAYRQLFMEFWSVIRRFLSKMLNDNILAEDIAQNIFMKVWLNREKLDENKSIKTYLYVLAKNEAINHIKRESRSISLSDAVYVPLTSETQETLDFRELDGIIRRRIALMPSQRRMIFEMSRRENLSNKEIAEKLNISVRTVEKHIELALKDLKNVVSS